VIIHFFGRKHKVSGYYNPLLLDSVRKFMEERAGWNETFYGDFKYLKEQYSSMLTMYDSDYAAYENALVIKNEIEKFLQKHKIALYQK
jgi:hypothetical protein